MEVPVDSHLFVIFGATGDLTRRKLLPALYRVITENEVGDKLVLLGVGRTEMDDDDYRKVAIEALAVDGIDGERAARWCSEHIHYQPSTDETMDVVRTRIEQLEIDHGLPGNRVLYLALPPVAFPSTITALGGAGLNRSAGWTRIVIEKPFGVDLESALDLNRLTHTYFDEPQVYRIDHFLGKETVQNVLAFRFANLLFESSWNRDRIDRVEITVGESIGIEGRAGYYEAAGVLRDMVQNHLTQLLTLVAMEAPNVFGADPIRTEKVQAMHAIGAVDIDRVVFGQYTAGTVEGRAVPGYLEEPDVPADSKTPTFVAMRLAVNNWRWQGVPFYLRTGKRMPHKSSEIVVTFKAPPVCLFHGVSDDCAIHQNVIIMTIQPNEGFELRFEVKAPGAPLHLESHPLHFDYDEVYESVPDAYQTLILDVLEGDQTLFVRADEVETSWQLWTPLLGEDLTVYPYPAGTWGPEEVDEKLGRNGAEWLMRRP
jgi:glucose-6-phosphate 1-dehydrogenase